MGHYAILNSNNIVIEVITGRDENEEIDGITDWEQYYGNLRGKTCKRTSYNTRGGQHTNGGTPFRKNYAGIGYKYNSDIDGFVPPKPFDSWTLNNTTGLWEAPVAKPDADNNYEWNDNEQNWEVVTIPSE